MKQYLCRIVPVRPDMLVESTPEEDEIVSHHFRYLTDLTEQGILILAGRTINTDYSSHGIFIFRAEDDVAAQAIVAADPAVKGRIFRAELFPYRVALLNADNAKG